jgi:hypothetical protein
LVDEDVQRLYFSVRHMGDIGSGNDRWTPGGAGTPLEPAKAVMAERWPYRRELELRRQAFKQVRYRLRYGFVALHRAIRLVKDGIFDV